MGSNEFEMSLTERRVVLLDHTCRVVVDVGQRDGGVRLARLREGGVVDTRDADAQRCERKAEQ